ncbi:hypothetical protein BD413DRAFT_512694 [Trametes elegans]|nr:hypothetical protein BD413DRAFT_512694 [Trametes elegans]
MNSQAANLSLDARSIAIPPRSTFSDTRTTPSSDHHIALSSFMAQPSNIRTIDNAYGGDALGSQPTFEPDMGWAEGSQCMTCNIHPGLVDVSQAFNGTWSDSTYHPGQPDRVITAMFTGTAVTVYNILANGVPYTTTFTNLTFSIDGDYVTQFQHTPDNSQPTILYHQAVFVKSGLANTRHTIEIRASGPTASLILFDYIEYTVGEVVMSSHSPTSTSTIPSPSQPSSSPVPIPSASTLITASSIPSESSIETTQTSVSSHPVSISLSSTSSHPTSSTNSTAASTGTQPTSDADTAPSPGPSSSTSAFIVPPTTSAVPPSPSTRAARSPPVGAVAGGAAVGVLVVTLLACLAFWWCRRRRGGHSAARDKGLSRGSVLRRKRDGHMDDTAEVDRSPRAQTSPTKMVSQSHLHPLRHGEFPRASAAYSPGSSGLEEDLVRSAYEADRDSAATTADSAVRHSRPAPHVLEAHTTGVVARPATSVEGAENSQSWHRAERDREPLSDMGSRTEELPSSGSLTTDSRDLRAHVARLERELVQMRAIEEMRQMFNEPPPRYEPRS